MKLIKAQQKFAKAEKKLVEVKKERSIAKKERSIAKKAWKESEENLVKSYYFCRIKSAERDVDSAQRRVNSALRAVDFAQEEVDYYRGELNKKSKTTTFKKKTGASAKAGKLFEYMVNNDPADIAESMGGIRILDKTSLDWPVAGTKPLFIRKCHDDIFQKMCKPMNNNENTGIILIGNPGLARVFPFRTICGDSFVKTKP